MRWCVGPLVTLELKTRKTRIYDAAVGIVCVLVCWKGVEGVVGVRLGVGCPCPPLRNDIVNLHHLYAQLSILSSDTEEMMIA